jgi:hypothetical protein
MRAPRTKLGADADFRAFFQKFFRRAKSRPARDSRGVRAARAVLAAMQTFFSARARKHMFSRMILKFRQ